MDATKFCATKLHVPATGKSYPCRGDAGHAHPHDFSDPPPVEPCCEWAYSYAAPGDGARPCPIDCPCHD